MQPYRWVVENGTRVDLDGFASAFSRAWSELTSRFLKVECWQSYREGETNASQDAYERGDLRRARELLEKEAEADRPLYADVRERGLDFARIRVVREPLTDYLRYELMSYRIRAEMGENIEVVRADPGMPLPNEEIFDFLLFDRSIALVHDYGQGRTGAQTGGWLVRDAHVLRELEDRAVALRDGAAPLGRFLAETDR